MNQEPYPLDAIEQLSPLDRYECVKEIHGPLLALWRALHDANWNAVADAMNELERRASIEVAGYDET